jgi:hypothetical protein
MYGGAHRAVDAPWRPGLAEGRSMPLDLRTINLVLPWIILIVLLGSAIVQERRDRDRIRDEADSKDAEVRSIRRCWLPFRYGPFAWFECLPGCRVYRVRAGERSRAERTAYVLIGPRRLVSRWESWESRADQAYGTLTWRWAEKRHPTSR